MSQWRALAPAKVNLGLFVGPVRARDGRHEIASVMQSISLADELTLARATEGRREDELSCPGVDGAVQDNLAWRALQAFRAASGWDSPPLRLSVHKRIPVAAGLGGGSADAAAALRLASLASGLGSEALLRELAGELGADVPAQLAPGRWLAAGAGEQLEPLRGPRAPLELVLLPLAMGLATGPVYAEADRLALVRPGRAVAQMRRALSRALAAGEPLPAHAGLLDNDLQAAAVSLCPAIADSLAQARGTEADHVLVSGSGPTVAALFSGAEASARAKRAAEALAGRSPAPIRASAVDADFARALG